MTLIWYGFLLISAFAAMSLSVFGIRYRPTISLAIIAISIIFLAEYPNARNVANVAGMNISYIDVLSIVLMIVYLLNVHRASTRVASKAMIAFSLLVGLSLLVGAWWHGIGVAVNESRQFLWMVVGLLWSTTLDWRSEEFRRKVLVLLVVLGWALVVAAGFRARTYGFGAYGDDYIDLAGDSIDRRILVSGQALVLLFGLMASWTLSRERGSSPWWMISGLVFAVILLLSQQRTVWAVAGVVFVAAVILDRERRAKDAGLVVVGAIAILSLGLSGLFDSLVNLLLGAANDTRTYDGRSDGWAALLEQARQSGARVLAFGEPFGFGFARVELGRLVAYSPHNWYLTIFLRVGLVGLTIYCAAIVGCIWGLLRHGSSRFWVLIVIALSVYSWTYSTPWYTAVLLGAALCLASANPAAHLDFFSRSKSPRYNLDFSSVRW